MSQDTFNCQRVSNRLNTDTNHADNRSLFQTIPIQLGQHSPASLGSSYFDETPNTARANDNIVIKRPSMRGRLCPFLTKTGVCKNINECVYSHTVEEARCFNQNFKTKICDFAAGGFCKKANQCRFAHSFSELLPMNVPTSSDHCGRHVSSVSTVPEFNYESSSPSHSSIDMSDTERHHVCYVAPPKQRKAFKQRPRASQGIPLVVPSSFHYVEQLEKKKQGPVSSSAHQQMLQFSPGHHILFQPAPMTYHGSTALVYTPVMYNMMMSSNVVYED